MVGKGLRYESAHVHVHVHMCSQPLKNLCNVHVHTCIYVCV